MKAFIVDRYGGEDGARLGEMPDPELRQDDVSVQIHAAEDPEFPLVADPGIIPEHAS